VAQPRLQEKVYRYLPPSYDIISEERYCRQVEDGSNPQEGKYLPCRSPKVYWNPKDCHQKLSDEECCRLSWTLSHAVTAFTLMYRKKMARLEQRASSPSTHRLHQLWVSSCLAGDWSRRLGCGSLRDVQDQD